jgi:hypothetical protein
VNGDRDGEEHDRPERLADAVCDHFGVVHGSEHGPGEEGSGEDQHDRRRLRAPGRGHHQHRELSQPAAVPCQWVVRYRLNRRRIG